MVLAILNIIFKNAFRQTHLRQIGRDPKFFDYEHPIKDPKLDQMQLQVLYGYKASVNMSEVGVTVTVDSLFRFMSTVTCLDKIRELKRQAPNEPKFKEMVEREIVGSSVIADWGNKRTYIVDAVDCKTNPTDHKF